MAEVSGAAQVLNGMEAQVWKEWEGRGERERKGKRLWEPLLWLLVLIAPAFSSWAMSHLPCYNLLPLPPGTLWTSRVPRASWLSLLVALGTPAQSPLSYGCRRELIHRALPAIPSTMLNSDYVLMNI